MSGWSACRACCRIDICVSWVASIPAVSVLAALPLELMGRWLSVLLCAPALADPSGRATTLASVECLAAGFHRAFCRLHAGAGPDFNDLLCPAEHALVLLPDSGQRHHFCDVCAATVPPDSALWRCEACDFDVCADCARCNTDQGPPAVHPADLRSGPPSAEAEDEDDPDANPCGIVKRLPGTRLRRQGGVLTAMLACGRVAHVQLLAGAESPTQVTILLAQLRAVRPFSYVIYDDACHLARFVRNRARRSGRLALGDLASAKFVIDRFHRTNHTACLDEGSRHYLAEVKIEERPVLAGLNTAWSESWNAWLDVLTPQIRPMDSSALGVYLWLVADLWNTQVVSAHPETPPVHSPGPLVGRLKRSRGPPDQSRAAAGASTGRLPVDAPPELDESAPLWRLYLL